jgi:inner membrane protein
MPLTSTHALVPCAVALAFAPRPTPWRLIAIAALASAAPDADWFVKYLGNIPATSIYSHRGAAHSLFVALLVGLAATLLSKSLRVSPLTAGVAVGAAMASHGFLDMMTNSGEPVAYLWPLTSTRLWADWRPIQSTPVHLQSLVYGILIRVRTEAYQLILPMFAAALAIRGARSVLQWRTEERTRIG